MQQTRKHMDQSRRFLVQAQEELGQGDLPQASEKAWGAAAQIVKAWAESRGRFHGSHDALWSAADEIVTETGDPEIARLFGVADSLHINFYEDRRSARMVEYGVRDVGRFVEKIEALL